MDPALTSVLPKTRPFTQARRAALILASLLAGCSASQTPRLALFQDSCLSPIVSASGMTCARTGPSDISRGFEMLPDEPLDRQTWQMLFYFPSPHLPRIPFKPPRAF